ncbi:hypothetical protein GCK72_013764 [Caenorhabditis remanei]|uniref:Serine protease n=1 Tax=Caenorhabditis remanei TaxID=31234 RepID=A0A6A5GS61_CAERE|nr:hypothetical protein GCK72_013764 [Caenorhabditis remanei]KAF1757309.1 hypothetical protein GCK72_013764 [Caenorhabditis remanei]
MMAQSIRVKMMDKEKNVALSGNFITESSLRHAFLLPPDAIVNLSYESNGMQIHCAAQSVPKICFLLPDGWSTMQFFSESNRAPSRIATSMDIQERPLSSFELEKEADRITRIMNFWESRVFRISGNKLTGTCVLINDRHVLTAAHLSFKLNQSYKIKGAGNQEFTVNCVFICKPLDFAILQSDDFPILELSMTSLERGAKFFMMGYPDCVDSSNPTITKGTIKGHMDDCLHLVGTPGSKRGYSGAPVFNDSGRLAGLLLGGTSTLSVNTTIQECLDSSAEQKYARILGIGYIVNLHSEGNSDSGS